MAIRSNLKKIMKEQGVSRMDIVRGANISYPTVVRWESGTLKRLDPQIANRLRNYLNISEDDLYTVNQDE